MYVPLRKGFIMALKLKSTSGAGNGLPYTDAEKKLAHQSVTAALKLADIEVAKPLSNSDCTALAQELQAEHDGVDTLARAIFRGVIRKECGSGKDFVGTDDYPKQRDPTSIQLLMRGACDAAGVDKATKDTAFPRYGATTKAEA